MRIDEVRTKYLEFFKKRGHEVIPSSSLIPLNDPTTLFTGSGMQPLIPFLLGQKHPKGDKLTNSQKCFRAEDIEEVGDNRHTTFFEMLGNWSLGDYFKEKQLPWFFEFLTSELSIKKERLWVTCFSGDEQLKLPKDTESAEIWKKLGIPKERIHFYDSEKNWWSRSGSPENMPAGEPGGPDSEVFFEFTDVEHDLSYGDGCHPNCDCGRFMEIGNSVFMQYIKNEDGSFSELPQKNVDFGGGLERIAAAVSGDADVFNVDALKVVIDKIGAKSKSMYDAESQKSYRIMADHLRGAVLIMSDGMYPSNTDAGYFVRRLLRRAIRHMDLLGMEKNTLHTLVSAVVESYKDAYPNVVTEEEKIAKATAEEEEKFRKTLERGVKEIEKIKLSGVSGISAESSFKIVTSYGLPFELVVEEAERQGLETDEAGHERRIKEHQVLSRSGAEHKFKGGLADNSEKVTQLHTSTHLMLAGLRKYLGDDVHQAGSNITEARSRFDFTHHEKVDRKVLDKVEEYVNEAIENKCDVVIEKMPKDKAQQEGVEGSFWEKYPDTVNVYMVKCDDGTVYSRELCGGPHVQNTSDIKGTFKITKEEATSAGVRRIRAILE